MTDRRFYTYLALAIIAGLIISDYGDNLEAQRKAEELPAFTEQDVFCAEFMRQEAEYADQYTDRELLRICRTHRIVSEDTQIP